MKIIFEYMLQFILGVSWLGGLVLAVGFWQTLATIFCPCYAWYLVLEKIMIMNGVL